MARVPEIVGQLIERHGGVIKEAAAASGIHYTTLGKMARGDVTVTDKMKARIEAALSGETANGAAMKSTDLTPPGRKPKQNGGRKNKAVYNDPPLVQQLLAMYNGRRSRAAAAMGFATASVLTTWAEDHSKFDEFAQMRVQRALKGEPPPSDMGDTEPDTYKLGLVIGLFPAANFERAIDAAEAFAGKVIFKASVRTEWLGVFKMQTDKAKLFKKLMSRDAVKISCP